MDHAAFGSLMLDYGNPDKSLQTRPLLGHDHADHHADQRSKQLHGCKVYNPQDGSTNDVLIFILNGGTTLRIGGACVGTMCAVTQDWPKVADAPGHARTSPAKAGGKPPLALAETAPCALRRSLTMSTGFSGRTIASALATPGRAFIRSRHAAQCGNSDTSIA